MTDVGGGEFAGEIGEGGAKLGKLRESGLTDDGDGVVRREIVEVVFEGDEAEGIDEAVGGVAGDDVDLMGNESAVDQAEVHDVRLIGEMEMVAGAPAGEAVGALEEFVADANAPSWRDGGDIGGGAELEALGIVAADDHGESVLEAERLGDFEMEALGVLLLDALVEGGRISGRRFVEDSSEGRAGVLDVEVEVTGEEGFVDEKRAAEIGLAFDGDAGAGFNVLGEKLGENDLLGEEF